MICTACPNSDELPDPLILVVSSSMYPSAVALGYMIVILWVYNYPQPLIHDLMLLMMDQTTNLLILELMQKKKPKKKMLSLMSVKNLVLVLKVMKPAAIWHTSRLKKLKLL